MKQLPFYVLSIILTISCVNNSQDPTSNNILQPALKSNKDHFPKTSTHLANKELIRQYEVEMEKVTDKNDKEFIHELLTIIKKFNGKNLDSTKLVVGNIDGDEKQDTIYNRIYLVDDTVIVNSWWIENKDTIWSYKLTNPYAYFNSSLFAYDTRDIWATFAIGIIYGSPEIFSYKKFNENVDTTLRSLIYDYGIADLYKKGITLQKRT